MAHEDRSDAPSGRTAPSAGARQRDEASVHLDAWLQPFGAEPLHDLEGELERVALPSGEDLFLQHDEADAMYVLLSGDLEVWIRQADGSDVCVDRLSAGAIVGEMALLTGQRRGATVRAAADAVLARLSRSRFIELAESHPEFTLRLTAAVGPRLARTHLAEVLTAWFGALDTDTFHAIERELRWVHLAGGEVLFREGDTGDAMYLVVSGRLAFAREGATDHVLGDIGRGESVGEFAVLTEEPRSATVIAVRDSDLVELPKGLIERHPRLMTVLARSIARRAQAASTSVSVRRRAETFALLPITPGAPVAAFAARLSAALGHHGSTMHLDARRFDDAFGKEGASRLPRDHPLAMSQTGWLSAREAEHAHVVYQAEEAWSPWTRRCLRQADRIVLVGVAGADPRPGELERAVAHERHRAPVDLVLIQPDDALMPRGTLAWLTPRSAEHHYHVRMTNEADVGRVARGISGRSAGVVLSGGGARGYVHVGLLRACEEADLAVDIVGGTSMGALVGGTFALSQSAEVCFERSAKLSTTRFLDLTLPIAALTSSRRVTAMIRKLFGEVLIEDLWTPFFCVSTNLSRGDRTIHDRGPLWHAVRASLALPGVFSPVLHDGDVLVDGGITSNYPVDVMRTRVQGGVVIGSNAFPLREHAKPYEFGETISGWRILWRSLWPGYSNGLVPSIVETLYGATSINARYQVRAMAKLADVNVVYPVEDYDPLDFAPYAPLVDIGHQEARRALEAWRGERARPARG